MPAPLPSPVWDALTLLVNAGSEPAPPRCALALLVGAHGAGKRFHVDALRAHAVAAGSAWVDVPVVETFLRQSTLETAVLLRRIAGQTAVYAGSSRSGTLVVCLEMLHEAFREWSASSNSARLFLQHVREGNTPLRKKRARRLRRSVAA